MLYARLLAVAATLAACAAPTVVMQNPATQATFRCEAIGFTTGLAQRVVDECRRNYEKAGWVVAS
jgi:hypothetical protein